VGNATVIMPSTKTAMADISPHATANAALGQPWSEETH